MAGHSKWANIQHRKNRQDEKRGKVWTKIIREVSVAARVGGGDVATNPRLRLAMEKAAAANMPKDNVQRAIAKAFTGWGIPSAQAISAVRRACPAAQLIASGGIRDGIDAAKAIRLGANLVGQAAGVLDAALIGPEAVVKHFQVLIEQLRIACFCTGSANLAELAKAPLLTPFDPSKL